MRNKWRGARTRLGEPQVSMQIWLLWRKAEKTAEMKEPLLTHVLLLPLPYHTILSREPDYFFFNLVSRDTFFHIPVLTSIFSFRTFACGHSPDSWVGCEEILQTLLNSRGEDENGYFQYSKVEWGRYIGFQPQSDIQLTNTHLIPFGGISDFDSPRLHLLPTFSIIKTVN